MTDTLCHLCLGAPATQTVPGYAIHVCTRCYRGAEHGWPKRWEETLFAALGRASLLIPDRNERGLLPREYAPPADYAL